ncbi:MAG: chitobiase/beta-hexosaminidase C-terminal domain-containing protein [Opitutales bacterium]|nr:chitobiase/beta-hexosaminidase C-terminal domain-containing protein [Opitutales bacterium]
MVPSKAPQVLRLPAVALLPRIPSFCLVLFLAAVSAHAATVAHWRFEATPGFTADSGPNALTLGTIGTAPLPRTLPSSGPGASFPGLLGEGEASNERAAALAGNGNFTRVHAAPLAATGPFTVEAFVHRERTDSSSAYIVSSWQFANGVSERSWGFGTAGTNQPSGAEPGELFLVLSADGQSVTVVRSGIVVPDAADAYVAAVFEADRVVFHYRLLETNSGLVTSEKSHTVSVLHAGTGNFNIGAYNNTQNRWRGLIDEVRISSGALGEEDLLVDPTPASEPPVLLTAAGVYSDEVWIEFEETPADTFIRYTLDGSAPVEGSPVYTGPFALTQSAVLRAVAVADGFAPSLPQTAEFTVVDHPVIGRVRPRSAREIPSSTWSIGGETLDRGFAVYAEYRDFLGPLGVKAIRLQAGWARTEQSPGEYDWSWLDEPVFDAAAQGVNPWINVSYGNPIYPGGGDPRLFGDIPRSEVALAAWDAWLTAMVERYKDVVTTWEIWNEAEMNISAPDYTALFQRSARIIRSIQPEARILAIAFARIRPNYLTEFFDILVADNELHLVDEIVYHHYVYVPESLYSLVQEMLDLIAQYSPDIGARQGENGAPSTPGGFGALTDHDWTERSQAKWNLRRMLGDHGRGIANSLFGIADMQYSGGENNDKGIILTDPVTQAVIRPKESYYAAQNVYSIFDDTLRTASSWTVSGSPAGGLQIFRYEHLDDGRRLFTVWRGGSRPEHDFPATLRTFTLPDAGIDEPVWVDLLSGQIRALPAASITRANGLLTLHNIPVADSPIIVGERSLVLSEYDEWVRDRVGATAYLDPLMTAPDAQPHGRTENLVAFALGGDDGDPSGFPQLHRAPGEPTTATFHRLRADVTYRLELSEDLVEWETLAVNPGVPGEVVTFPFDSASPLLFVRLTLSR